MDNIEEFCPIDSADWRRWLELNHRNESAIWLVFYKKASPKFNLSWSEAVDQALCFGWIDSTKRTINHESYKQYFSKRKAKSNWSKVNKDKVKALTDQGLMEEAGHRSIEMAKENGSWTILDGVEELVIPEDLKQAFANNKSAHAHFEGLSKSIKKMLLYWVGSAKRVKTREKRIAEIVENANDNMIPKQFR